MLRVTPIADEDVFNSLSSVVEDTTQFGWKKSVVLFIDYLLKEDHLYTVDSANHPAYLGQSKLIKALSKKKGLLNNEIQKYNF